MDDWNVYGLVKYHITNLGLMLERCQPHQISLNLQKCIFCVSFGILLGHIICKEGMLVNHAKILIIVNIPQATMVNPLRETLGHTGYYHNFIRGSTTITTPMEKMLKKDEKFKWIHECQGSLDTLKKNMVTMLILVFLNLTK